MRDLVEDIFRHIVQQNKNENGDSIPHSDALQKHLESALGIDAPSFDRAITILKNSHKILAFEIFKENSVQNTGKVEGYVDADISTVRRLREIHGRILAESWAEEHRQRKTATQIVRDLLPMMNSLSGTPLGAIFTKAFMLEEFEKLLERDYPHYSEDWKAAKLDEILAAEQGSSAAANSGTASSERQSRDKQKTTPSGKNQRAVDQVPADVQGKFPVQKIIQIYGIDIFFRTNLRQYKFDYLYELIESKQIVKWSYLKRLKDMLGTVKSNAASDPLLNENFDKINRLERIASRFMNMRL